MGNKCVLGKKRKVDAGREKKEDHREKVKRGIEKETMGN